MLHDLNEKDSLTLAHLDAKVALAYKHWGWAMSRWTLARKQRERFLRGCGVTDPEVLESGAEVPQHPPEHTTTEQSGE